MAAAKRAREADGDGEAVVEPGAAAAVRARMASLAYFPSASLASSTTSSTAREDESGASAGYLYVMQSPAEPLLCKVGYTSRSAGAARARLAEARTFNPRITYAALVHSNHAALAEKEAHALLREYKFRPDEDGGADEWFEVDAPFAAAVCALVARDYTPAELRAPRDRSLTMMAKTPCPSEDIKKQPSV